MRGLPVVCALALAVIAGRAGDSPAQVACDFSSSGAATQRIHSANLDRDPHLERVIETVGGCPQESVIALEDRCGRTPRLHRVPGLGVPTRLDVVEANGREDGRELLFALKPRERQGRYRGNAGLVHFAPVEVGKCPRMVYLLSYFLRAPPRRAGGLAHFQLLRSSRRELRLYESFGGGKLRETRFRYMPGEDRYAVYRVITKA